MALQGPTTKPKSGRPPQPPPHCFRRGSGCSCGCGSGHIPVQERRSRGALGRFQGAGGWQRSILRLTWGPAAGDTSTWAVPTACLGSSAWVFSGMASGFWAATCGVTATVSAPAVGAYNTAVPGCKACRVAHVFAAVLQYSFAHIDTPLDVRGRN